MDPLLDRYSYRAPSLPEQSQDVMVFSRHPINQVRPFEPARRFLTGAVVDLSIDGVPVTLMAVHTIAPFSPAQLDARDRQISTLAEIAEASVDRPVIALGDFNLTPYAPAFDRLTDAGMSPLAETGTPLATWPTWLPILGLPIDHVLGNQRVAIDAVERGPDIGSDHYPVVAQLRLLDSALPAIIVQR